jgi:type IV pilus assembly protein PilW
MKHTRGFSLVEMMIALSIGLVAVGAVSAVLISSASIYRVSDNRARMQENARFSVTVLQDDVRMAGFMGCFNIDMFPTRFTNLAKNPTSFSNDYSSWVGGYEAGATSWSPALNASIGAGGHAPIAGNDVLVVRMPTGKSVPLSDTMTTTSVPIPVEDTDPFTVGELAIVSDCGYANLFVVGTKAAAKKLVHAANDNTSPKLTRVFSNIDGAIVTPVTTISYFIAAASDGVTGNKALWRQDGAKAAEEIADGVEQMALEYGIDTDAIADGVTNRFVTADQIGTARVTAVKVSLLVKSPADKLASKTQTFNFDGYTGKSGGDKRLYVPFSTTIALRNRVN